MKAFGNFPWEAVVWLGGLAALAWFEPGSGADFTLCPLAAAGWEGCPGCGLGHAISYFFAGDVRASLEAHPLGIFAIFVLSFRIVHLISDSLRHGKNLRRPSRTTGR